MLDQLASQIRGLTAREWDLYEGSDGLDRAVEALNEGMVQALHQPTEALAWAHIDKFMAAHKHTGANDTEPRALARRFLDQVDWAHPRPQYPLQWDGRVYVIVTGAASDKEDEFVQGVYLCEVPPAGIDLCNPQHVSATATAVLDCFHKHEGIAVLEDFDIELVLSDGRVVVEDDAHTNDAHRCCAAHHSKIQPEDLPIPVRHRFGEAAARPAAHFNESNRG